MSDSLVFGIFPPACYEKIVVPLMAVTNPQWAHSAMNAIHDEELLPCAKVAIAKALGFAILAGSFALKLPQIFKIASSKSVLGLNALSLYLEVPVYTLSAVYALLEGYPFTSYGEVVIILLQQFVLITLLWTYQDKPPSVGVRAGLLGAYGLGVAALVYATPPALRPVFPTVALGFVIAARVPQVVSNVKQGHTGQLALATCFLNFGGSIARFFTTLVEQGGDPAILLSYGISTVLNGALFAQCVFYWSATKTAMRLQEAKRRE